ncbi:4099_t:CDS:2, partial [Ambispora leptoticha]
DIKSHKKLIRDLHNHLKQKFEAEENNMSELLTEIVHNVVKEVKNKEHEDIPNVILKELKLTYKVFTYCRTLWSQHDNKYIGYVDFDNENAELEAFAKSIWNINDQYEVRNIVNNEWYLGKVLIEISIDNYLDVEVAIETAGKVQLVLTSWSKIRVDLAEHTLSLEVKKAMEEISELKYISQDTQFDLVSSINGFLRIVEYVLSNCLGAIIQPKRISQDMLEVSQPDEQNLKISNHYKTQIQALSTFNRQIFKELLDDNLSLTTWLTNLENRLNNYKCAGNWFSDFQLLIPDNISIEVQQLVAYILLEKTIRFTFKQVQNGQYHNQFALNYTESWTIPEKVIDLEPAENDPLIMAYQDFTKIKLYLDILSTEHVEYVRDICSKTITIIPGTDFIRFIYYLKSLILQLFEKHIEYGPDILIYINNNLINNQSLKEQFHILLQKTYDLQYDAEHENQLLDNHIHLSEEIEKKDSSSLQENIKTMNADRKNSMKKKNESKIKIKKGMLPKDLDLVLDQLKVWAHGNGTKDAFEKTFTLAELKALIQ